MVVARHIDSRIVVVDRLREMVRLAAGLQEDGQLTPASMSRALRCLERFGQRLRAIRADRVRVVGTNTLRRAHGKKAFLARARRSLGQPIEIISGIEEARLIYLGVAHSLSHSRGRRLVVDIGGGSTELIIGREFVPQTLESLYLGCVSMSEEFFPGGRFSRKRMHRAQLAAGIELETIVSRYRRMGWDHAVGSSGSFRAILEAIREISPGSTTITGAGLEALIARLDGAGMVHKAGLVSISPERAPVFAGGLAIAAAVFESLHVKSMQVADGALREGILHDLIGRQTSHDVRETTVAAMQRRYNVDLIQARQVERTAIGLNQQLATVQVSRNADESTIISWAARLHEIGLEVSHAQYHRHGAYLLEYSDLPGFAREEQKLLALLVGSHRRRLHLERMGELVPPWDRLAPRLMAVLRLAALVHRPRDRRRAPGMKLRQRGRSLTLTFPAGWLRSHPLTCAALEKEADYLRALRFTLRWR